jgi:hypothetical protein
MRSEKFKVKREKYRIQNRKGCGALSKLFTIHYSLFTASKGGRYRSEATSHTSVAGPLPKRTQREERQADENGFSSVVPHDDALCKSTASGQMRCHDGFAGVAYLLGYAQRSIFVAQRRERQGREGPLPKRTQCQRRTGGFARRPYLPEAR